MYPKMQYWVHLSANMYPKWCFWILNYFLKLDNIRGPADRKLEFQTPLTTFGTPLATLKGEDWSMIQTII